MRGDKLRVDFEENIWDRKVRVMIEKGFTSDVILNHVPISFGQLQYRRQILSRYYGIGVYGYRRGESKEAKDMIARIDKMLGTIKQIKASLSS